MNLRSEVAIWLKAKNDLGPGLKQSQAALAGFNANSKKLLGAGGRAAGRAFSAGVVAGLATIGAGTVLMAKSLEKASEQERSIRLLEQAVRSTGGAAGLTARDLAKMAAELQGVTTFGDENLMRSQAQLLSFTNITRNSFRATLEAAMDLSVAMDQDMKSSVIQLGKALNDPIANLSALSRTGIQFTQQQKDMVTALWESGRQAEAQAVILAELNRQFGGQAQADAATYAGRIKQMWNIIGDIQERIGGEILPMMTDLATKARDYLDENQDKIAEFFGDMLESAAAGVGGTIRWLVELRGWFNQTVLSAGIMAMSFQGNLEDMVAKVDEMVGKYRIFVRMIDLQGQMISNPLKARGAIEEMRQLMAQWDTGGMSEDAMAIQRVVSEYREQAIAMLEAMKVTEASNTDATLAALNIRIEKALDLLRAARGAALSISDELPGGGAGGEGSAWTNGGGNVGHLAYMGEYFKMLGQLQREHVAYTRQMGVLQDTGVMAANGIADAFGDMFSGLSDGFMDIQRIGQQVFSSLISGFIRLGIANAIPALAPGLGFGTVGKATGGDVYAGRSYWVGERGPERVVFPQNARVLPAEKSSAAQPLSVTVNLPAGSVLLADDRIAMRRWADRFGRELERVAKNHRPLAGAA